MLKNSLFVFHGFGLAELFIIHYSSLAHVPVLFQFLIIESYGEIASSLTTNKME